MQIHLNQQNDSKNGGLKCNDPEKRPVERPSSPNTGILATPQSHAFNSTGEHSNTFQLKTVPFNIGWDTGGIKMEAIIMGEMLDQGETISRRGL